MRIAVISDTHDNHFDTLNVLKAIRSEKIDTIIHCGDMTSGDEAELFSDFVIHHVQGNNDIDMLSIGMSIQCCRPGSTSDRYFTGMIGGKMIAALHGHNHILFDSFIESGKFDYIFHGHTHRQGHSIYEEVERVNEKGEKYIGNTQVINPGAIGGAYRAPRGFCIVDLDTDEVEFHGLD